MAYFGIVSDAKNEFNDHCTAHKCKIGTCDDRRNLWLAYMHAAEVWGGFKTATLDAELLRGLL